MAADWLAIRNDYINGGGSYRKLAEKYGVSFNTLKDKAVEEGWKKLREDQHNKTTTKTQQKTQEKISDALSEEAAMDAEARVLAKRLALVFLKELTKIQDTNDFRRIVQCLSDMGVFSKDNSKESEGVQIIDDL